MFSSFQTFKTCFTPYKNLFLDKYFMCTQKIYSLTSFSEVFHKCQFKLVDSTVISLLCFTDILSICVLITVREMLSFSTVITDLFISPFSYVGVHITYVETLLWVHTQNWSFVWVNQLWPLCNISFYPCTYTLSELYVSNIDNLINPVLINIYMTYLFLHAMVWMCLLKIYMLKSNCQHDSIRRQRHWKDIRSQGLCFYEISAQRSPRLLAGSLSLCEDTARRLWKLMPWSCTFQLPEEWEINFCY